MMLKIMTEIISIRLLSSFLIDHFLLDVIKVECELFALFE
jgi:hypothetical protein